MISAEAKCTAGIDSKIEKESVGAEGDMQGYHGATRRKVYIAEDGMHKQ